MSLFSILFCTQLLVLHFYCELLQVCQAAFNSSVQFQRVSPDETQDLLLQDKSNRLINLVDFSSVKSCLDFDAGKQLKKYFYLNFYRHCQMPICFV